MVFPKDHPELPDEPKGMKQVLLECGLWNEKLTMKCCQGKCAVGAINCCAKWLFELQLDFREQLSLLQEVIGEAGHICIFLLKFYCELNFIEYFWGVIKRYL